MNRLDYSTNREETIRGLFDTTGLCLEIGPSYNPILSRRAGQRVETVDHCDAAALREKYATQPSANGR